MQISSHPTTDRSGSTLRARQMSLPEPPEEYESYPDEFFNHIDRIHD